MDYFQLNANTGYFTNGGVDVMAFDDIYPVGHQAGVSVIMHGNRVATNGDIRFEQTPGQWQPTPKQGERIVDAQANQISVRLSYPDIDMHLKGFNPMIYPDYEFSYVVKVKGEGESISVTVDLDKPIPDEYVGKICFNMELFPGALFGKPWIMDLTQGIFPNQPNGPILTLATNYRSSGALDAQGGTADRRRLTGDGKGYSPMVADDIIAKPYAVGKRFTARPDDPYNRLTIESETAPLKLYDGRMNHNNGWFVISGEIPAGVADGAVKWKITPHAVSDWLYKPVVQTSQLGYHTKQPKLAIVELDARDAARLNAALFRITEIGAEEVAEITGEEWGKFLRYNYLKFDFSFVAREGLYKLRYGESESCVFRIAGDIYDRGVWQPVLEYFLPVQMCHMRVNEKYRVWHGLCHIDDARMAPVNYNHFDGYIQGESTLTKYQPGECVPGLDAGGWHDAGDYDLRVESQAGEAYLLALAYEEFNVDYDVTTIDQARKLVEIHQPDGKNDILQQIEHGLLTVVGGNNALGRLYRGIICNDLRQYVLLGDGAAMTDGVKGDEDDRWVFTEDNPARELTTAAQLAAAARAMRGFNDEMSANALAVAREIYDITADKAKNAKLHAATELFIATGEAKYGDFIKSETDYIVENIKDLDWIACRAVMAIGDKPFECAIREAMKTVKSQTAALSAETPYGIPYRPHIWGAGWDIQRIGFKHYYLHKAFPDIFDAEIIYNALNFVLGCHPGSNTASFATGVGAESVTAAYGVNRGDWSGIPGGVVSGTALIRPDFPELLRFPFLWQQTEYVMGGGSSHYMFLALAARKLLSEN